MASEFNCIMEELQDVEDDILALKNRSMDGYAYEQNVEYDEFSEIIDRLDSIEKEALEFLDEKVEEYKEMTEHIVTLRDDVLFSRDVKKPCYSTR